jgi:hypothetical protein
MRRHPCLRGKAARKAASIQDSFDLLLTANEESPRGPHDLRRHGLKIVFPHEPKWDVVTEFRVQAGQPGLDHSGIFLFGEHSNQLEGERQTLFAITIELASIHLPIDGAHVPDTADVGCELAPDEADELLDDLRNGKAKRLATHRRRPNGWGRVMLALFWKWLIFMQLRPSNRKICYKRLNRS